MRTIIREYSDTAKKVLKLYKYDSLTDPREKECFEFVEYSRQRANIKRIILFSIVLILSIITYIIMMVAEGESDMRTRLVFVGIIAALAIFILIFVRFYRVLTENYREKKNRRIASALYVIFWDVYYVGLILSAKLILSFEQSILLLITMVFISLSLAMLNKKECFFVAPFGFAAVAIYVYYFRFADVVNAVWAPILVMLFIVTQTNHMQRLETFYDCAINIAESAESKRRLAKVFEEVFDLAFEFDIRGNRCRILRPNDAYEIADQELLSIEEFTKAFQAITHIDDTPVIERNLNFAYLSEHFLPEKQQVYFEMRIRNKQDEYRWISVFVTRESDIENAEYLLCLIQDIEERKNNENKLKLEAEKDPLTQLYNKTTVKSLIEETFEKDPSGQHALIVIDIDNFKIINDTRGHVVGDQILLAFSAELNKNFRESDILGRAGGDEFIVLLKNVQSVAMVCDKLQRLASSFKKYGIDHGFPGRLSMSIGVAMFNKDGRDYEELFKKADAALYEAKRNGKDQYKFSITKND